MFKLDNNNDLIFRSKDLKEVYEPIVKQYGFVYEEELDRRKNGLVWTKLYTGTICNEGLLPVMVIRETDADPCPAPEEATYFSTSLWWEDFFNPGFMVGTNPDEFGDGLGDEVEDLIICMQRAQKEVNEVLEKCRQELVSRLTEIKAKLIAETEEG